MGACVSLRSQEGAVEQFRLAQEYGNYCGVCGTEIPYEEPLLFVKVPATGRSYYKVPSCDSCVGGDWNLWGYYEAILTGKRLTVTECATCGRCLLVYAHPYEDAFCSRWCRREDSQERRLQNSRAGQGGPL
jgi:hypothetical protein